MVNRMYITMQQALRPYTISEYSPQACEQGVTTPLHRRETDACRGQVATKWRMCYPLPGGRT